jgi:hypothetical protein
VDISRRRFLTRVGSAAALAGAAPIVSAGTAGAAPAGGVAATTGAATLDLATVTPATFRPHVGTKFKLRQPGQPTIKMKLLKVQPEKRPGNGTRSFSLRFGAGAAAPDLPQGTYELRHDALGRFDLFLVPGENRRLRAVINHLLR